MSEKEKDHIADLTETFDNMRHNGLKLNPEVHLRHTKGAVVRMYGVETGHTGKSLENRSVAQDAATK
jgi:hypothetical protein